MYGDDSLSKMIIEESKSGFSSPRTLGLNSPLPDGLRFAPVRLNGSVLDNITSSKLNLMKVEEDSTGLRN